MYSSSLTVTPLIRVCRGRKTSARPKKHFRTRSDDGGSRARRRVYALEPGRCDRVLQVSRFFDPIKSYRRHARSHSTFLYAAGEWVFASGYQEEGFFKIFFYKCQFTKNNRVRIQDVALNKTKT